jgi:6-pyruvoyltetrahydropterin/6-carboxytetrahydropterin synthase
MYRSTKTYGHNLGLSCCFRQWRAESHCRLLHGYALEVGLVFEAEVLDATNWVMDFGGLKDLKNWLVTTFDHTLLLAEDDPAREAIGALAPMGVAQIYIVPATGCEAFAKLIYDHAARWMLEEGHAPRVRLVSVEVREHGANSALYVG